MNKTINVAYFFILCTFLILPSCKKDEGFNPVVQKCSTDVPYGVCDNQEDICFYGKCINKNLRCGEALAPCEDPYNRCIQDEDNGGFKCIEGYCSYNNPDGTCQDGKICSKGSCKNECSPTNKRGACVNPDESCVSGVCYSKSLLCSNIVTDGICEQGKTCSNDSENPESTYSCQDSCSATNPSGACTGNKICKYGACYEFFELCSLDNTIGICEDGKICKQGKCEHICSEVAKNGACKFDDQLCFEGRCSYKCSEVRPNGYCPDIGTKCVEGTCRYKCSETIKDGYCEDQSKTCVDGYCKPICSPEVPNGACPNLDKTCVEGECQFRCMPEHPFGVCLEAGYGCLDGSCIEQCSVQFPSGSCPEFYQCISGSCQEIPCNYLNPTGPCPLDTQRCNQGICMLECSNEQPNGWCEVDGLVCFEGACVDPTTKECSPLFTNGLCSSDRKECLNGICVDKECSPQYPKGRCEDGKICNLGVCSESCYDSRPILTEGEDPSIENGGVSGSCCVVNEDCRDGFESYGKFPTNICIRDKNLDGPYCIGLSLTEGLNSPMLCSVTGGCNGCVRDEDCQDPYPDYGDEGRYFCSMLIYYDFEVLGQKSDINISYCQRIYDFCERDTRQQGAPCDTNCSDAQCATGLHCIKGVCTGQCKNNDDCSAEGTTCMPLKYHLPDTNKDIFLDACLVVCDENSDCSVGVGANGLYNCSGTTYKSQVQPGETPTQMITYCMPDNDDGTKQLRQRCYDNDDCIKGECGEQNLCTIRCNDDADCGQDAFCSYNRLMTGVMIDENINMSEMDLNYLGMCRYLDSDQGNVSTCKGRGECPDINVGGRETQCLPRFDLIEEPSEEIKSSDTVYGRCGVLTQKPNVAYAPLGDICNNTTQFCESDLCVCGNGLCEDGNIGKCRSYCETSANCEGNEYCKRVKIRDEVTYARDVYAGVCTPRAEGDLVTSCNTSATSAADVCSVGETCLANPVNTKPESHNLNKFGVEYICVDKNQGRAELNESCQRDSDCNSKLCHPNTNKCTHACTNTMQCNDLTGNTVCDLNHILIEDVNPDFIVTSGICK